MGCVQAEEGRQWRAAMQRALAHWSLRLLYAGFAQWLLYAQVGPVLNLASCHLPTAFSSSAALSWTFAYYL